MNTRREVLQAAGAMLAGAAVGGLAGCHRRSHTVSNQPPDDVGTDDTPLLKAKNWDGLMAEWNALAQTAVLSHVLREGLIPPESRQAYLDLAAARRIVLPSYPFSASLPNNGQGNGGPPEAELRADAGAKARVLLELNPAGENLCLGALAGGGLGFPPAGAAAIAAAETGLGQLLPPGYKQFLAHSNGWLCQPFRLVGVEQIKPFRLAAPEITDRWKDDPPGGIPDGDYFVYDEHQQRGLLRRAYVLDALAISLPQTSQPEWCLLNPHVRFRDGEWEVWLFSPASKGARRFRAFAGLFEFLYTRETQAFGAL